MSDEEIYQQTDDHEFQTAPGWKRRENGSPSWEPACCYRRPWMWPQQTYCGFTERHHRMQMIHGPVFIKRHLMPDDVAIEECADEFYLGHDERPFICQLPKDHTDWHSWSRDQKYGLIAAQVRWSNEYKSAGPYPIDQGDYDDA